MQLVYDSFVLKVLQVAQTNRALLITTNPVRQPPRGNDKNLFLFKDVFSLIKGIRRPFALASARSHRSHLNSFGY